MADDAGTTDLLVKVLERTQQGKLSWEMMRDDDDSYVYFVEIAKIKIAVRQAEFGFRGYNRGDPEFIVYDADDTELDYITTSTDGGFWHSELHELLRVARLSARKATGKYAAALAELDRTG